MLSVRPLAWPNLQSCTRSAVSRICTRSTTAPQIVLLGQLHRDLSTTRSVWTPNPADMGKQPTNAGPSKTLESPEFIKFQESLKKYRFIHDLFQKPKFRDYLVQFSQIGTVPTIISILLLHELTAVGPLLLIWYLLYQLDWEWDLSGSKLLTKCHESIAKLVGDKYPSFHKENLIISGTIAFAAVKVLGPLRILATVWLAPKFGRIFVLPLCKSWKRYTRT